MVKTVPPETLKLALDSWESLKKKDNYEKDGGTKVMKFLFEKCPKAKPMFGYDLDGDVDDEFLAAEKFVAHAMQLISMFDKALSMIGEDGLLIDEQIKELGAKHVNYGVQAEMFPIMGKALMAMLEDELGPDYNDEVAAAWKVVFHAISEDLMKTVLRASREKK